MSTVRSYDYQFEQEQKRRMQVELQQRQIQAATLGAEQSRHRVIQMSAKLHHLRQSLQEIHTDELVQQVVQLEAQIVQTQAMARQARIHLEEQVTKMNQLLAETSLEDLRLQDSMQVAQRTISQVDMAVHANLHQIDFLQNAATESATLATRQQVLDEQLAQVNAELSFLTQRLECSHAAMSALLAMEKNNYQLRNVISQEGLISYFVHANQQHQIAVKIAPVEEPKKQLQKWEIVAETFAMEGETCLDEMDDFESSICELGKLERNRPTIYPKDESGHIKERKGMLPVPDTRRERHRPRKEQLRRKVRDM